MTRKHFEAVAAVIKGHIDLAAEGHDASAVVALHAVAMNLAQEFRAFNSNFDRTRFLRACGLDV